MPKLIKRVIQYRNGSTVEFREVEAGDTVPVWECTDDELILAVASGLWAEVKE